MSGYSPAMIEQAISMALTIAHHTGRTGFAWDDLVEAVTTLDAGTAIGSEYVGIEERWAVAIHEAGHAVAGHLYLKGARVDAPHDQEARRPGRRRAPLDDREGGADVLVPARDVRTTSSGASARWQRSGSSTARTRTASAATSPSVTARAALMVGGAAMGPQPFHVTPSDGETEEQAREEVLDRFEKIGLQIMARAGGGGPFEADPIAGVLGDPSKRTVAAQILGQAYVTAHNVARREPARDRARSRTRSRTSGEIMGDELLEPARTHSAS